MPITNGEVTYGRTVKTGDYENKRVDVKLSFTVEDGQDYSELLTLAGREAHDKAHGMLGIKVAEAPAPAKRGRPPKAPDTAGSTVNDPETPKALAAETPALDPLRNVEMTPEDEGEALFDESAPETQPEVTDVALSSAMNRKVADLKPKHGGAAPKLIKELINKFVEPPKKSHDIPQNLRGKFLEELAQLQ